MLLDCCRHFMSKAFVKRYIDLLAYHKMNVLHWHLTEDQGWRIEIKKYPKLTDVGAWRGQGDERYGGYYTQRDVREIVEYARSRYVTVVPEIEMPGHSMAALASYPWLGCKGKGYEVGTHWGVYSDVYCAGNDRVFEFLTDVLSEVIGLFPSEYIHIGGDECPKTEWKACPKCQARIKAEGLQDEHKLQSYFIRRIEEFLSAEGRRLIGWDEILEGGLAPGATVQSWRGMDGAVTAATAGHDVIASPTSHCYLDYAQTRIPGEPTWMGYIPLERSYAFEPTPAELTPAQAQHVLGLEGNMWTEHAPQERVDWQIFPRLCALAEVGWSPKGARDWDDFSERMQTHYRRLDALGVTYFVHPPHCTSPHRVFEEAVDLVLENPLGRGAVHYTLDGHDPAPHASGYVKPVRLTETTVVKAQTFLADGRTSNIAEFHFRKLRPREPAEVPKAVPGLAHRCYEGVWEHLPDFDVLTPTATGRTPTFDLGVRTRDDHFALRFTGYLKVPTDGIYTFYLVSDDGSRLWIGSDLVVDHDGLHSASEQFGQIILKAGMHPISVAYFEAGGAQHLEVNYAGPGISRQPVPASALWWAED
jgi:hexosaminidase